ENHAAAGAGKKIHLLSPGQDPARLACGGNQNLAARQLRHADHFGRFSRPCEAAARTSARLDEWFQREPEAVSIARDRDRVRLRLGSFLPGRDLAGDSRVEAERGDDALAVFEFEESLNRLAVAG